MTPAQVKAKIWMSAAKGAVLPIATLMVVLFMMVPVPAIMLDIGFITNIMISLAVLMVALNAAKPLDFSSFPTVLLFATLLRLAPSHVRFGHFEYFYYTRQHDQLKQLAAFVLEHHFADCNAAERPYAAMFRQVVERNAELIARGRSHRPASGR